LEGEPPKDRLGSELQAAKDGLAILLADNVKRTSTSMLKKKRRDSWG